MPRNARKNNNNPPSVPSEYDPEENRPNEKMNVFENVNVEMNSSDNNVQINKVNAVVLDESGKPEGQLPNEESVSIGGRRRHRHRRRSTRRHPLRRRKTHRRRKTQRRH